MKTREQIQNEITCTTGDPVHVQATATQSVFVFPPSVGLMMALKALGNTLAMSLEEEAMCAHVTQEDTLIFYWAVCQPPATLRERLAEALATGDKTGILAEAEAFAWLLTPSVVAALNAAIARTREQVAGVQVSIIPDPKAPADSKN